MIKILHFADAHIDMNTSGRHDAQTNLPIRVLDFLKSLDEIIDTAIQEKVDLAIFAGDTYRDRSAVPTYQREWGRRIMRLSRAGIQTLLLTGNHDVSPATNRAHAIHEFDTLEVPNIRVIHKPTLLTPEDLAGLQVQILAVPWVTRAGLAASMDVSVENPSNLNEELEILLTEFIQNSLNDLDPNLPAILTSHASVEGATFGNERSVMLGKDMSFPLGLMKDHRLDYVALGHIHKAQDLNKDGHPPVIYPGSIERVDYGEANDEKFFVIAKVERNNTEVTWVKLKHIRPFFDIPITLTENDDVNHKLLSHLPDSSELKGAMIKMSVTYPSQLESLIDEAALRAQASDALEFQFVRRPQLSSRVRLPEGNEMSSSTPQQLLDLYWKSIKLDQDKREKLAGLATDIIQKASQGPDLD